MPANHQIEIITYDAENFDEFKDALRTAGLEVKAETHILDDIEYTHFATLPSASFDDGIYFNFTPSETRIVDEQEVIFNSVINYRVSNNSTFYATGTISGHQRNPSATVVYQLPYIQTSDGGLIISGLGFRISNNNTDLGTQLYFLPPYGTADYWEFGFIHMSPNNVASLHEIAYSGNNIKSLLSGQSWSDRGSERFYSPGTRNIIIPIHTLYEHYKVSNYNLVSHRVFYFSHINEDLTSYNYGSIYKDENDDEYYVFQIINNSSGYTMRNSRNVLIKL